MEVCKMNTSPENTVSIFRVVRMCMCITLREMAKRCNVSVIYLGELERGKKDNPSSDFILKFANGCGVDYRMIKHFIKYPRPLAYYQMYFAKVLDNMAMSSALYHENKK
jgi:transcriptional regulator with XRE-family HTH domain